MFFSPLNAVSLHAAEPLSISGITEPIMDVTLSATIGGTVARIFMKEGTTVANGAVILEMDKKLDELEVERRKLIWESKAELEAAAVREASLKWLYESNRELFMGTGSVSKEELEKAKLDYELAVAEHKRLDAQEKRELIEYEMARESLHKRSLVSPIQGTIIKLFLDEGEGFQENQPLAHVVDTSRGLFICNAEEWIGRGFKKGQTVDLRINTGKKTTTVKGTLVFVSPIVDAASGLLEIKAEFDNHDGAVRPGVAGSLLVRGI
jgi:RND family efflux transporter MFP subunit